MRFVVPFLAANNILLMRKWNHSFLFLAISRVKVADRFAGLSETIEEDSYCRGENKLDDQMIIIELG